MDLEPETQVIVVIGAFVTIVSMVTFCHMHDLEMYIVIMVAIVTMVPLCHYSHYLTIVTIVGKYTPSLCSL